MVVTEFLFIQIYIHLMINSKGFLITILLLQLTLVGTLVFMWQSFSQKNLLTNARTFYSHEVAFSVSPHTLRGQIDKKDSNLVIVDVRLQADYNKEHIIGSINIPVSIPGESQLAQEKRIAAAFKKLGSKEIVMYCYSAACMASRNVGNLLAQNGIVAKHLNIGWNEWKYDSQMWNNESEWGTLDISDYIETNSNATSSESESIVPCTNTSLGC